MRRFATALTLLLLAVALAAPLALWGQPAADPEPAEPAPEASTTDADDKDGSQAVWSVLLLILVLAALRMLTVIAWPDFTRRCARIFSGHRAYTALWGLAVAALVMILAIVLGSAGGAGTNLAALLLLALVVVASVGATGVTLPYGERLLERDGLDRPPRPLLSIMAGNVVSSFLFLIPCLGQVLLLLVLIVGLGAAIQAWSGRGRPQQPDEAEQLEAPPPEA